MALSGDPLGAALTAARAGEIEAADILKGGDVLTGRESGPLIGA